MADLGLQVFIALLQLQIVSELLKHLHQHCFTANTNCVTQDMLACTCAWLMFGGHQKQSFCMYASWHCSTAMAFSHWNTTCTSHPLVIADSFTVLPTCTYSRQAAHTLGPAGSGSCMLKLL